MRPDETFTVDMSPRMQARNRSPTQPGHGHDLDDERRPDFDRGLQVTEGNTGTTDAIFRDRSPPSAAQPVRWSYATADITRPRSPQRLHADRAAP